MIWVVIICVLSCVGMIAITLFRPKFRIGKAEVGTYWIIVSLGAITLFACQFISFGEIWEGLTTSAAINPIKILVLFLSMTVISIFLDETGFFRWLANWVLKRTGNSQIKIFTALYLTIVLVTVFTSNDIVILTFTPFICYFTKNAKINPVPYLVSGFVAANTSSMLFIIGNPTNIYLATSYGIDFVEYFSVMWLPTLFAIITAYVIMVLVFLKKLKTPIEKSVDVVHVEQKLLLIVTLVLLAIGTILFVISSYIDVEMWLIALCTMTALVFIVLLYALIRREKPNEFFSTVKRTPFEIVPFVISMFVLVLALEKYNVTAELGKLLETQDAIIIYGFVSVLFANLVNNIPMSVLFTTVLLGGGVDIGGVYATVIGSNIGAFLTPVGALAGIMWLSILKKNDIKFSYLDFLKYGVVISLPVLLSALFGLRIVTYFLI